MFQSVNVEGHLVEVDVRPLKVHDLTATQAMRLCQPDQCVIASTFVTSVLRSFAKQFDLFGIEELSLSAAVFV